jgi:hypothetical protein
LYTSSGTEITGNYINSVGSTTAVSANVQLAAAASFIISDSAANPLFTSNSTATVLARAQSTFVPVTGPDLVNVTYLAAQLTGYIKALGGTQVQNLVLTMTGGSDSMRFVSFSGTTQLQINDSGSTVIYRGQSSFTPSTGNDLVNKTYADGVVSGYIPYTGALSDINIGVRNFTSQYNKIDNSFIGCSMITTSIATVGGTQNLYWRPNFVGPYYGWILSSEATANPGVDLNIRIPYLYSDAITSSGTITASGIISTTSSITASGSITSTSSNIIGFKGIFTNNGNYGPPSVGVNGGVGDHLILYPGGVSENPYSLGIDSYTLWLSASGNSSTSESLFNILFYSGQRARWKMNGNASTANLTSQQTYMNISDQSGNKLVSAANSLTLSTTSNGPILLSVNNGTSNSLIVSDTFCTLDDLNIRGTLGNVSGAIIRLGNNSTLSSGYDAIEFRRSNSNPVIFCADNYIVPYVSGIGSFIIGSQVGDMCFRVASGKSMRFSSNAGAYSQMTLGSFFTIGDLSNTRVESASAVLRLVVNNNNCIVIDQNITNFYASGTPFAYLGYYNTQDQLYFLRYATTNPAIQFGDQQIGYASVAGAFIVDSDIGDICNRLNNKSFRVSSDNGSTTALIVRATTGNVGVNNGTPSGKLHVNQGFSSTPESVIDWTAINSVFSNSTGSRSAGFGITLDSSSNSAGVYLLALTPNISWNRMNFSASSFVFRVNGSPVFNISYLGTGLVYSNGGTLTSTNPSDIRLKNTIIPLTNNTEIINQLNPVSFLWNDQQKHGAKLQLGFIAQEVQKVLPAIVSEYKEPIVGPSNLVDENGMRIDECITNLGVDTMALIPFLVGAFKEHDLLFQNNLKENIDNKEVIQKQQDQINHLLITQELLVKQISELTIAMNNITSRLKG